MKVGSSNALAGPPMKKSIDVRKVESGVILRISHWVTLIVTVISLDKKGVLCILTLV